MKTQSEITFNENEINELYCNEAETIDSISLSNDFSQEEDQCLKVKIFFSKDEYYEGEINDDYIPNGHGVFHYLNGDVYIGHFVNGMKNGKGTYKYKTGNLYKGEWENDIKQGEGIFINTNDKWGFKGAFENDNPVSNGHLEFLNEEQYLHLLTKEEFNDKEILYNDSNERDNKYICNKNTDKYKTKLNYKYKNESEGSIESNKTKDSFVHSPKIKYISSKSDENSKSDSKDGIAFYDISIDLNKEFFKHITISNN